MTPPLLDLFGAPVAPALPPAAPVVSPAGQRDGQRLQDHAVARHVVRDPLLIAELHRELVQVALGRSTREVTADDATRLARTMERARGRDPRWIAAVFRCAGWEHSGRYVRSGLPERHARPVPIWVWTGPAECAA